MEKSDIILNIPKEQKVRVSKPTEDLQRTEQWFLDRNGDVSASISKKLMGCGQGGGKLSWNDKTKVYDFSSGIVSLVYEKAKQRKSNRYIDGGKGTYEMRYGTAVEPLILKAAKKHKTIKKLLDKGHTIEEVGYKSFPDIPNAGSSSDAIIRNKKGVVVATVEMKACTSWGTHFKRCFEKTNDKSLDFWQTQSQMISWEVNTCYYLVAEPPKDLMKYVFAEDISSEWKSWKKECKVSVEIVEGSSVHQEALKERIRIVNEICEIWMADEKIDLRKLTYKTIDRFKNAVKTKDVKQVAEAFQDLAKKNIKPPPF